MDLGGGLVTARLDQDRHVCQVDAGPCPRCRPDEFKFRRVQDAPGLLLVQVSTGRRVLAVHPVACESVPVDPAISAGRSCSAALYVLDVDGAVDGPQLAPLCDLEFEQ
jgi:hypothetical protein